MKIWNRLKQGIGFLFREELDISHRVSNLILLVAITALIPSMLGSVAIGTDTKGIIIMALAAVILSVFIVLANKFYTAKWPLAVMCILVTGFVFPGMYFACGGKRTGMVLWIAMGAVLCFLLLDGWLSYAYLLINIVMFAVCMMVETLHPSLVSYLNSELEETYDVIFAFAVVVFVLGATFRYQSKLYNREHKRLLEKDEELVDLNEALEQASHAKSDFLANMSHEIRTPINAILGMDEMIIRDCNDNDILNYAEDIDAAGKQLLTIINDILDFSKIESGKFEIHEEDYDVLSLINDCYTMMIGKAEAKNLRLIIKNDPELPARLHGDEVRIRQIIINLLSNAVKYTEEGYIELDIRMFPKTDGEIYLDITVKDTGIGISEENQKALFDNFRRIDEKEHRNIEGTGLGLAITKQLTELMGGNISVNSAKGEGSEFNAVIPQTVIGDQKTGLFDIGMEIRRETKKKYKACFTAGDARILVVDDVKVNLNVVRLLLRDTLLQMDFAESGKEALNYLLDNKYDCVLMDAMMPEMDGIQTLHEARKLCCGGDNENVPMIALTANAISGADKLYYDAGFCDYVTKPIKAEELEKALIKAIPEELVHIKQ